MSTTGEELVKLWSRIHHLEARSSKHGERIQTLEFEVGDFQDTVDHLKTHYDDETEIEADVEPKDLRLWADSARSGYGIPPHSHALLRRFAETWEQLQQAHHDLHQEHTRLATENARLKNQVTELWREKHTLGYALAAARAPHKHTF
jgi:DNA repair ATPase RecN